VKWSLCESILYATAAPIAHWVPRAIGYMRDSRVEDTVFTRTHWLWVCERIRRASGGMDDTQ